MLLQMHFIALVCMGFAVIYLSHSTSSFSLIFPSYLVIYVPNVITIDLKMSIDEDLYLHLTLRQRLALAIGYGFHNVCTQNTLS